MKLHELVPVDVDIWRVGHLHHYLVHDRLESLNLYRGQHRLLFALWDGDGKTHKELSIRLNVQPATITKMVQRMEQNGFVERKPDANDQRVSRVFLTQKGIEIQEKVKQLFLQIEMDEIEGFSKEESDQFQVYLQRVQKNLKKHLPKHQ